MAKYKVTNENKAAIVEALQVEPAIAYWELAAEMGLHENTVSKWLRMPTDEQTAKIQAAIKAIRARQ